MPGDNTSSTMLSAAIRFATWILPPHRKAWADAMFNEMAYIPPGRAAWHWVFGCTLSALKERASHELMSAFTLRGTFKALFGLSVAALITVGGVYATQKPYQRERILLLVLHGCRKPGCPPH